MAERKRPTRPAFDIPIVLIMPSAEEMEWFRQQLSPARRKALLAKATKGKKKAKGKG
jgi:hypothetical protein